MFNFFKKHQKKNVAFTNELFDIKNDTGIFISRVELRPFYDSRWDVTIFPSSQDTSHCTIVRTDDETPKTLMNAIKNLNEINVENIKSLDKKAFIYYD